MTVSGAILLALIVGAHLVFFWRMTHIVRLVNLGEGTLGDGDTPSRIKDLLVKGFGQSLVLRKPSGIGHAFIFWGFFVLTYGTLEGLIAGVVPGFTFEFMGAFYYFMNFCQDLFAVLVVGALAVAVYRRAILRPVRLQASAIHHVDAYIIIGLIVTLIVAFFGMRILVPKAGFTPVTDFLRTITVGEVTGEFNTMWHTWDWIHNIVVLGFLVYIPFSKHIHVICALPNLFFREQRVRGAIEKLDLEDEEAESFGVNKVTEFTRKDLLDLFACTECGRCQEACPAYATGKPLSPKKVILDLKDHLLDVGSAFLKDRNAEVKPALFGDIIEGDVIWACTTCRACEEVCPVEITPMTKIVKIRQGRVLMEGDFPEETQNALRNIEGQSNPWGLAHDERDKWAEGMDIPRLSDNPDVEYLFFVGCAGSYDQRYQKVTKAFARILKDAGISFAILGKEEVCTGDSPKRVGNDMLGQMLAQQNVETMNAYGVKKVVTACPHCFNSIRNEFPQYGGDYKVIHHSDLIDELIRDGKISPKAANGASEKITYHDSCYLGRYNDVYEGPRNLVKAIKGEDSYAEMKRSRVNSFCCGAGGGRMWMEERIGTSVSGNRAKEAIGTGAKTLATACPFCMTMLSDGVKGEGKEDEVAVKDVAELVAESLDSTEAPQTRESSS